MSQIEFETIVVSRQGRVVLVELNRPEALNALNTRLAEELTDYLCTLDDDPGIGCFVITGKGKAFAAGADIKEMAAKTYPDIVHENLFARWDRFALLRTPKIAAVNGFALGGGCELAMMCDIIFAAESAKFGQPEIKLGVMPGMGGSQRMLRAIGKAKAMDMILTGRMMDVCEAERAGLVARVFADDRLLEETMQAAGIIADYGRTSVLMAKEAVARAEESSLSEGLLFERRAFQALFATKDQKEGMAAFCEKRSPNFSGAQR